jgi:hypothetical protein
LPEKTVLCFGSESVDKGVCDDKAFLVCKELDGRVEGVRFVRCDSPMEVLDYADSAHEDCLYILDVVRGLKKVSLFEDIDSFRKTKSVTAHDHDLGLVLEMLAQMKKLPPVTIIGIPTGSNPTEDAKEVEKILSGL